MESSAEPWECGVTFSWAEDEIRADLEGQSVKAEQAGQLTGAGVTRNTGCVRLGPVSGGQRPPQCPWRKRQKRRPIRGLQTSFTSSAKLATRRWQQCDGVLLIKNIWEGPERKGGHWLRPRGKSKPGMGQKGPRPHPKAGRWQLPLGVSGGTAPASHMVPGCAHTAAQASPVHMEPLAPTAALGSGIIIPSGRSDSDGVQNS